MSFMNWFLHPIQHQYAVFTGRMTRKAFWMYVLVYLAIFIPLTIAAEAVLLDGLVRLLSLVVLVPSIAITTRRLHDVGKSGWWQLLFLIPVVGLIVMIVFLVKEGDKQENVYGPIPAEPAPGVSPEEQPPVEPASTEPPITPAQ
jgi:uncharacterized membrane protein YhaH (DUF805 family)